MIEVKINGVTKWQVNEYTFNDPQMGIRSINMTVKHPSMWVNGVVPDTADFTGAYVDYEGEKYSISSSKPTAEKSNTSLDYIYTLIFKGEEDELTRRKVRNLALVSFDNYVSQGTTFSIYADINQFKQLLENNLKHYFGNKWSINLSLLSSDSVRIDVSNVTLWDLLSKTYEYFGVRFNIRGNTINIGYEPEEIYHVFDYGNDGGLVKITKTAPDTSIVNRLSGMGGSRNVPMNYFTDRYSEFAPDPNPINSSVNIRNIMPKVFRDSVVLGDYKDYVEDLTSIASHGVKEDALAPNEDIYPSIAGVEVSGLGRIDEIIAVSEVIADKPDDENYSPTFHIWVKDIGFNLADEQYTSTQDAKISFTTGALTGYEFTILANGKIREVVEDTTKSFNGVSSKYRITLINSDEDFDATGRVLPNTVLKPSAGDHFVIYDIEMPFSYVANAEQRVQDWLEANLADLKDEKPTFSIEPMSSFFETTPVEFDGKTIKEKLRAGNRITVNADVEHRLHINNLTIQYGGLMPKYSFTVTDRVQVQGSTVARMQSQLDGVMSRQLLTERDIETLLSGFSTKYLSKVKPDTAQQLIKFLVGLEVGAFSSGAFGSGAAIRMLDGVSYAEVDNLTVRQKATFRELVIESLKHIGGQLVLSPARMKCTNVVDGGSYYKCYFDSEGGEIHNEFVAGDQARCQVFTGSGTKFYWRLVTSVGEDWINLSKTDALVGSDIPEVGDEIVQLGNRTDTTRQNAQILSTVGVDAPSWKQYKGINSFDLTGKEITVFSGLGNKIDGKTVFKSDGKNLEEALDDVEERVLGLRIGGVNLLRNTGFLGDFNSLNLNSSALLTGNTAIDTNPLIHWVHSNVNVLNAPSKSGKGIHLGSLQQNTPVLEVGETYIVSFKAKGANLNIGLVNTVEATLTGEYQLFEYKMIPTETKSYVFSMTGDADVYEIQLEKATIRSDYNYSIEDDLKTISQLQAINTITAAIKEADTSILGGLILTSMLQLGKYKDGVMEKVNAGINGIYNNDDDPAIWAGGSFDDAIRTVQKFIDNPNYEPTQAEWAEMANIVLTHGGDGFFRGYIYALGGFFRGRIESNAAGNKIIIDPQNRMLSLLNDDGKPVTELSFTPLGTGLIRTLEYHANGNRKNELMLTSSDGISMKSFDETTGAITSQIRYTAAGAIQNANLINLTDEAANAALASGEFYRTGRIIKVKI